MRYTLETQLRRAIKRDGRSIYALCRDSGLSIAPLQRFSAKRQSFTLASAEKLARALHLNIVLEPEDE